jgi:hypothetical protein
MVPVLELPKLLFSRQAQVQLLSGPERLAGPEQGVKACEGRMCVVAGKLQLLSNLLVQSRTWHHLITNLLLTGWITLIEWLWCLLTRLSPLWLTLCTQ